MKTKTYETIIKAIQMGHWVAVENKFNNSIVFLHQRPDGALEGTCVSETIERSIDIGFSNLSFSEEEMLENFTDIYKIVTPAPLQLQVGDKVTILENYRNSAIEFEFQEKLKMIGENLEIYQADSYHYKVWNQDKTDWFTFPHWAVAPLPEEEEDRFFEAV